MKPPRFDYAAPGSVEEAVALLAGNADAKVLAGGQSLVPLLSMRLAAPDLLVDLRRIDGLDRIVHHDDGLVIGAMARQRDAETSDAVVRRCPLIAKALRHVAHPQVRTQGTVVGSIVHADPAAELPAVAVALDARLRAVGPDGDRLIPASDLYRGLLTSAVAEDEVVTEVEFPAAEDGSGSACVEVARRNGDYALCGAVAQVTVAEGVITAARLAFFGVADTPVRASAVEAALESRPVAAAPDAAASLATEGIGFAGEATVSEGYRRHITSVVARRSINQALEAATG